MGFAEAQAIARVLDHIAFPNENGSLCPDCAAYEWSVSPTHIAATAFDLVCSRAVVCDNSVAHKHNGELLFFCSVACRDAFTHSPQKYLGENIGKKPESVVVAAQSQEGS
jgi:YHS domain-containing protein